MHGKKLRKSKIEKHRWPNFVQFIATEGDENRRFLSALFIEFVLLSMQINLKFYFRWFRSKSQFDSFTISRCDKINAFSQLAVMQSKIRKFRSFLWSHPIWIRMRMKHDHVVTDTDVDDKRKSHQTSSCIFACSHCLPFTNSVSNQKRKKQNKILIEWKTQKHCSKCAPEHWIAMAFDVVKA